MNSEKLGGGGEQTNKTTNDGPWGDSYSNDLPPFNPDQKEVEKPQLSEKDLANKMLETSSSRQDDLVDTINRVRQGHSIDESFQQEHDKFATDEDFIKYLEDELAHREALDHNLITALEDLDSPANAGKTLEEILTAREQQTQKHIETLAEGGSWGSMTEEQQKSLTDRRDDYGMLTDMAKWTRKSLLDDADIESGGDDSSAETGEAVSEGINIDSMVEDLQAEVKKRKEALDVLESRDQRDYGDATMNATVTLHQKEADLHVLKIVQKANYEQSGDETVSPENATATITKYITDREKIATNLTEQRAQYAKGSEEYKDLTKKRGKWLREIEAARRVGEQLDLPIPPAEESDLPAVEQAQPEAEQAQPETESAEQEQPAETEAEKPISNSEAEIRAVMGALESIRPGIEQLFAMSKGSLSAEQAAGYLLTSNKKMNELTAHYMGTLEHGQSVGEIQQVVGAYETEMNTAYGHSVNAINALRQKAQTLPPNLRGPMLLYCQNVENALGQIMQTVRQKDNKNHNTPMERQKADEKEIEEVYENEMSM